MSQQDKLGRVLASLHESMLDEAFWPVTSGLIDDACGTKGSALVVGKGQAQDDSRFFFGKFCVQGKRHEDLEHWYYRNYYPYDERVPRVLNLAENHLVHMTDLYTQRELQTSPAYNEACSRLGNQNGLIVRMDGPDGSHVVWTLGDSTASGGWSSGQVEMIKHLLPHIRQSVRVWHTLLNAEALDTLLIDLLDNVKVGVIHLDRRGRILEANDRARDLLQQGDGLRSQSGFLRAAMQADTVHLEGLLKRALPTVGAQAIGGSMTVRRSSATPGLVVHVNPVVASQMDVGTSRVAAFVLIRDPVRPQKFDPRLVGAVFRLTPAESRVAASMAEGRSIGDIAAALGRKESTIRWQVKRILRKHGLSRQADLVRLFSTAIGLEGQVTTSARLQSDGSS